MGMHIPDFHRKVVTVQHNASTTTTSNNNKHGHRVHHVCEAVARSQPTSQCGSPPPMSAEMSISHSDLPHQVVQLKHKLQANRKCKTSRFSFSAMRRIAVPPVQLPEELANPLATSSLVSGRNVPFTKAMHKKHKDFAVHTTNLDTIPEHFERRSFDSRTRAQQQAQTARRQITYGSIAVVMKPTHEDFRFL